jgi:uncharacterized membrane protein
VRAAWTKYWDRVSTSLWFVPSLMIAAAGLLAFAMVAVDATLSVDDLLSWSWVYTGNAQGATAVLNTIAGSTATLAGVVFSMTLVALTLASSQFGPLILRQFMRDVPNQIVIGAFVGTFLYCLLVLRAIRYGPGDSFVPHASITVGMVLAFATLVLLIYFIHHVAVSIQSEQVSARVARDLTTVIDRLFPEQIGEQGPKSREQRSEWSRAAEALSRESRPVRASTDGYLQVVDADALLTVASKANVVLRIEIVPGQHVVAGAPLAGVNPPSRLDDSLCALIRRAFEIGEQRTPTQDVRFAIDQLVEIALRALSPGVNEPFTALTCVDRLGAALCRLAGRETPSPYRIDDGGRLRIVAPVVEFEEAAAAAFDPLRRSGSGEAVVVMRLLDAIAAIAAAVRKPVDREALRRHAERIRIDALARLPNADDRREVEARCAAARLAIERVDARPAGPTPSPSRVS